MISVRLVVFMFSVFYGRGREFIIYQSNEAYFNNFISTVKNELDQNWKSIEYFPFNVQMNKHKRNGLFLENYKNNREHMQSIACLYSNSWSQQSLLYITQESINKSQITKQEQINDWYKIQRCENDSERINKQENESRLITFRRRESGAFMSF